MPLTREVSGQSHSTWGIVADFLLVLCISTWGGECELHSGVGPDHSRYGRSTKLNVHKPLAIHFMVITYSLRQSPPFLSPFPSANHIPTSDLRKVREDGSSGTPCASDVGNTRPGVVPRESCISIDTLASTL